MSEFDFFQSKTYRVMTGCGNIFITVCSKEGQIVKVIIHPKSSFACDLTFFEALNRATTFMSNRELEQTVEDLRGNDLPREGHYCQRYSASVKGVIKKGGLGAYSCSDAVALCLQKEIENSNE